MINLIMPIMFFNCGVVVIIVCAAGAVGSPSTQAEDIALNCFAWLLFVECFLYGIGINSSSCDYFEWDFGPYARTVSFLAGMAVVALGCLIFVNGATCLSYLERCNVALGVVSFYVVVGCVAWLRTKLFKGQVATAEDKKSGD